jgi:hypothetical protein
MWMGVAFKAGKAFTGRVGFVGGQARMKGAARE